MRRELVCLAPSDPPRLQVRLRDKPRPGKGEVLVRVGASSVNPIDAKRAAGYGRRLLRVKGAADFPCVLGNDVAGFVEALGPGAEDFGLGDRVFGLVATGARGGAHTSHVVLPQRQLLRAPAGIELEALAVIPYCFTTMFLAVRSTGLAPSNAPGRRVLVNGASALSFARGRAHDVNVRAAFMHLAADAAVSLGVVVAGGLIVVTGLARIDPIVSIVVSLVILWGTWGVLRQSLDLALDAVPHGIDTEKVRAYLAGLTGVGDVHDLHIWAMSTTETALTAHLVMEKCAPHFLREVEKALHDRFEIEHVTLQVEAPEAPEPCARVCD